MDTQTLTAQALATPAPGIAGTPSTGVASSPLSANALGKDAFLKLLITQLRNQDPLNPLDQNQFLAQTAQFSALEQLQGINKGIEDLKVASAGSSLIQAASLLGKTVQVAGGDFQYAGSSPASLAFNVDGRATDVNVVILDWQGNVIRTLSTGALDAGAHQVSWDGRDSTGRPMTPGSYAYSVSASGAAGVPAMAWIDAGALTGLEWQGGRMLFQMGNRLVRPGDIVNVH